MQSRVHETVLVQEIRAGAEQWLTLNPGIHTWIALTQLAHKTEGKRGKTDMNPWDFFRLR